MSEQQEQSVSSEETGQGQVVEQAMQVDACVEQSAQSLTVGGEPSQAGQPSESEGQQPALSEIEKMALLEALLLASGDPLSLSRIQDILGVTKAEVLALADQLQATLAHESRGIELVVVSEKLQLRTKAVFADYVRQLMAVKPRKLSQAALETLAVVAYQQPIVKSEIDKIRSVDVSPTIKTLLERKLIKIIGYQASVGQPALYGTTEEFLQVFGLPSLSSLPSIHDLKALVKEPGEAQQASDESIDDNTEDASDAAHAPKEEPAQVVAQ